MDNTSVESSFMEMLEPKVKELQEKFSKGEKLSLQDFNLLLLKTQYNHLNHLDQKLTEVAADVAILRGEFNEQKSGFKLLEQRFVSLEERMDQRFGFMEQKFILYEKNIELKLENFKNEIEYKIQKAINVNMRWSIGIIAFIVTLLKVLDMLLK